jgi:hypothetical protein
MSYKKEGVYVGLRAQKHIPWDTARRVRLKSTGEIITRRTLRITADHGIIQTRGLGLITRKDIGRILIVDELQDGRWIDYLEGP